MDIQIYIYLGALNTKTELQCVYSTGKFQNDKLCHCILFSRGLHVL